MFIINSDQEKCHFLNMCILCRYDICRCMHVCLNCVCVHMCVQEFVCIWIYPNVLHSGLLIKRSQVHGHWLLLMFPWSRNFAHIALVYYLFKLLHILATLVRLIVEYANVVWDPYQKYLIDNTEMIQQWATRWVKQDYRLISSVCLICWMIFNGLLYINIETTAD